MTLGGVTNGLLRQLIAKHEYPGGSIVCTSGQGNMMADLLAGNWDSNWRNKNAYATHEYWVAVLDSCICGGRDCAFLEDISSCRITCCCKPRYGHPIGKCNHAVCAGIQKMAKRLKGFLVQDAIF